MKLVNVVVIGAPGSGKSTLLKTLCEQVVKTPEEIGAGKSGQTCAPEFGRLQVNREFFFYLVGIPIDEDFQFIWERLADGLLGFVVMFDAVERSYLAEAKEAIKRLKNLTETPFVVALNKLDDCGGPVADELKKELRIPREEQVVCCDVADKTSAKKVLVRILNIAAKRLKKVKV